MKGPGNDFFIFSLEECPLHFFFFFLNDPPPPEFSPLPLPAALPIYISHLEIFNPADIPRFRALGVVANFQPLWAFADDYMVKLTLPYLEPGSARWIYPIGSLLRSGDRKSTRLNSSHDQISYAVFCLK